VPGFEQVLDILSEALSPPEDPRLIGAFRSARAAVATIVERETYGNSLGKHAAWSALNLPALGHLTRSADRLMQVQGKRYVVVHDNNAEFEKLFTYWLPAISRRDAPHPDLLLPDGTLFRIALTNFDGISMAASATDPLLRVADMLASTVARVAREATRSPFAAHTEFAELAALTTPALMMTDENENPLMGGAFAHTDLIARMLMMAIPQKKS
jgi:hypothetical protein